MKKKNTIKLSQLLESMEASAKLLKESYIFDGASDGEENYGEIGYEEGMEDEIPQEDFESQEMDSKPMGGVDDEIMAQIRDAALKGIEKYKDNVTDAHYATYKKIFLEIDKFVTDALDNAEKAQQG